MNKFENRIALVTGGGSGIGRSTCLAFSREGAKIVVSDINEKTGQETLDMVRKIGGEGIFIQADVTQSSQVAMLIEETLQHYKRLDCAFNNAGIEARVSPTAECTEEDWDRVISINLKSVFLCMKYELKHMVSQKRGAIVNCASVGGLVGFPGGAVYVASKHGVVGLTHAASLDYAAMGIRINAVCPGLIRTPMIDRVEQKNPGMKSQLTSLEPIGRMGLPEEVAESVLWLCSDSASFVTGHAMAVDGGWVAR